MAARRPVDRIVVDPGHDLNKNTRHSLELTRRLGEITSLGYPTLVALSRTRTSSARASTGLASSALDGSIAAAVFCVLQGARIVRVHNVRETVDAMRMIEAIRGWREPAYLEHNR